MSDKTTIFNAAVAEAELIGRYDGITRGEVAKRANCSVGLINKHFGDMPTLQSAVLAFFVGAENLTQIAWGLAKKAPEVQQISSDLKARALATLT